MRLPLLTLALAALPAHAGAEGLACTFTTLCSPLTDCQTHPGVPFNFSVLSGTYAFMSASGMVFGTPLSHLEPHALGVLFEIGTSGTLLLSVSRTGEAVMTQQDILPAGTVQSVSYFGTCEPDA